MLEQHQLASKEAIDSVIGHVRGRKQSAGAELTFDDLRRDVKQHFRERVVAKLTDPALSSQDSYRQMRTMLDDLAPADRGNLAEAWYHGRFASDADRHVAVNVPRTGGENAGKTERRVVDMVQGETAVEVKDIAGKIDANQFEAYLDLLKVQEEGGRRRDHEAEVRLHEAGGGGGEPGSLREGARERPPRWQDLR
jgi:hypothetical protein